MYIHISFPEDVGYTELVAVVTSTRLSYRPPLLLRAINSSIEARFRPPLENTPSERYHVTVLGIKDPYPKSICPRSSQFKPPNTKLPRRRSPAIYTCWCALCTDQAARLINTCACDRPKRRTIIQNVTIRPCFHTSCGQPSRLGW